MTARAIIHPSTATKGFRLRMGRCYELACKALLRVDGEGWILVHGAIARPGDPSFRYAHAWLESGPLVWDPTENRELTVDQYCAEFNAQGFAWWRKSDAMDELIQHNHYGPWVEYPPEIFGVPGVRTRK